MKFCLKFFSMVCAVFCAVCMTSCSHTKILQNTTPVYYSDSGYVNLLPTQSMTQFVDGPQYLEGIFINEKNSGSLDTMSFSGNAWVRANDTILSMTLFSGLGTTIAELTYARDSISFISSVMDVQKIKAEYVVSDFQTCFYPFNALKENFAKYGFKFAETRQSNSSTDFVRILSENGNVILRITRIANEIDLVNDLRRYRYHIVLGAD